MFETAAYAFITCLVAVTGNWVRKAYPKGLELTPNCLLTRYPLVFMTGQRSLFYFRHYWNTLPQVLAEHGYEVHMLELPWSNPSRRLETCVELLKKAKGKFHLIGDSSAMPLLEQITQEDFIASVSVITKQSELTRALRVHQLKGIYIRELAIESSSQIPLLDRLCVFLHNIFSRAKGQPPISACEVGALKGHAQERYRAQVLRHCISLAEDDLR